MTIKVKNILKLLLGFIGFYFFATIALKKFNESNFAEPIQNVVRERSLNPAAFFYSDNLHIDTVAVENPENYLINH